MGDGALGAVDRALAGGSPWVWMAFFALGAPWLRFRWGAEALYPGHWLLAALLAVAWLREGAGRGRDPLPLKGALVLCAYLAGLMLLRGETPRALWLVGATAANFAWGWAAYRFARHRDRTEPAMDGLLLFVAISLGVEVLLWALAALWPPACVALNCPRWPEDPPRFRGALEHPGQFALLIALALPVLATPLVLAWQVPQARPQRIVLTALAAAIGIALLAGGGAWIVPAAALIWLGLYRVLAPRGDPRDAVYLKRMALWMVVVPVLFFALFPGYLGFWFSLERPPWGHARIEPSGPTPRALSSERTTVFLLDVTNAGAFPLPPGAAVVPRLLVTPARGSLRAHDLRPAPLPGSLGGHETTQVAVPVRLPPWVREGYLSWQVQSADGRAAALTEDSALGLRIVNAEYRSLADTRENLLSAVAERARAFRRETFVPESQGPAPASAEKVLGDVLDTLIFSPLWGEAKSATARGQAFPANRPFLAHLFAEFGLIALFLLLRLGWVNARHAELLGLRTTKSAARLAWPLVPVSLGIVGLLALFSPALGTFHGQWGLFLLIGFIEGRHDRLVPPQPAAAFPVREGVRLLLMRLARGMGRALALIPRPRWPGRLRWPARRRPRRIRRVRSVRRRWR